MAEREVRNLKYQPPALEKLDKAKLSSDMILCLEPLMDWSKMNDEMRELWDDMVENVDTETDISEDEFDSNETNELEINHYRVEVLAANTTKNKSIVPVKIAEQISDDSFEIC